MTRFNFLIFLVIIICVISHVNCVGLKEKFTWSKITYDLTQEGQHEHYVFKNNIPIGANRWKDKLFITVPRRQEGIPSTLNYIHWNSSGHHNVPLIPYPNEEINRFTSSPESENFLSIYRIAIDPCDRLWVVDTGILEIPGNKTKVKKQRLIIMDLNTDKIIKTYNFRDSDVKSNTTLTMVVVDATKQTCRDAYAYLPDLAGYGLVVYSLKKNTSWRLESDYFSMEDSVSDLNIAGNQFRWKDGIFSIALTYPHNGYSKAFFHSLMGYNMYKISSRTLRNRTKTHCGDEITVLGSKGPDSQSSASDIHKKTGILFFGLVNQNAVGCWNTNKPFNKHNIAIIHKDNTTFIYPSDLKIYKDDLIVLTNSMPVFVYSKLDYAETNFRVWTKNVYKAIEGTVCE